MILPNNDNLREKVEENVNCLLEAKKILLGRLAKSPPGKMYVIKRRNGKREYYIRMHGKEKRGSYVSCENNEIIRQYRQKSYDEKALKYVNKAIECYKPFLLNFLNPWKMIHELYNEFEDVKKVIETIDVSDEEYIRIWISEKYERSDSYAENKQYTTKNGEIVRSKSERFIADLLYDLGIPYRYECKLVMSDGTVLYPDFTILDAKNRRVIIWEHFGIMDEKNYFETFVFKLQLYAKTGFDIGENLLITAEQNDDTLKTEQVYHMIEHYLNDLPRIPEKDRVSLDQIIASAKEKESVENRFYGKPTEKP